MMREPLTALVAGGTGVVGRYVVRELCESVAYGGIKLLTRRPVDNLPAGVQSISTDFDAITDGAALPAADHVYICLGTTRRVAGTPAAFRRVDFDYVVAVARRAEVAGARRLAVVSSVGADSHSRSFYLRVKGEMERAVRTLPYESITIARPGLLRGPRENDRRVGESMAKGFSPLLDLAMVGKLRRYHSIQPRTVADALIAATLEGKPGASVLEYSALKRLAG